MRITVLSFCVLAFLASEGNSFGDEKDMHASVEGGLVRITSSQSALFEILAQLPRGFDIRINAYGDSEDIVFSCESADAHIIDALQRLVQKSGYAVVSRNGRSVVIRLKGREGHNPSRRELIGQADVERTAPEPPLDALEGAHPPGQAAPGEAVIGRDIPTSLLEGENRDEVVAAAPPDEIIEDDGSAQELEATHRKARSGRGVWRLGHH